MNRNIIFSLIAIALLSLLSSCNNEAHLDTELSFKKIKYNDQIHLFGNDNYPAFDMDLKLSLPEDSLAFEGLYHAMLKTYFDSLYRADVSADKEMYVLADLLTKIYRELEEDLQLDSMDIGSSFNWQIVKTNEVLFQNKHYLSFVNEEYSFTGGAHGNTIRDHYVFDLKKNLVLEADDFFDLTKCEELIQLQKQSLEKAGFEIDGFWEDGFRCDDNFYILDKGFVFHYDQYEIASYAAGPMDIFISFEEIKPFMLNPEILDLFLQDESNSK